MGRQEAGMALREGEDPGCQLQACGRGEEEVERREQKLNPRTETGGSDAEISLLRQKDDINMCVWCVLLCVYTHL